MKTSKIKILIIAGTIVAVLVLTTYFIFQDYVHYAFIRILNNDNLWKNYCHWDKGECSLGCEKQDRGYCSPDGGCWDGVACVPIK